MLPTKTYYNVPLVTLLISKYHLLPVICYKKILKDKVLGIYFISDNTSLLISYQITSSTSNVLSSLTTTSINTISSSSSTSSVLSFVSLSTSSSLPTLSYAVTMVFSSSPSIQRHNSPVIISIVAGVVYFVIDLCHFTVCLSKEIKNEFIIWWDEIKLTMINQLYSQEKPAEYTLISPLYNKYLLPLFYI